MEFGNEVELDAAAKGLVRVLFYAVQDIEGIFIQLSD
ncbi:hypothetical protein SDC9_145712 [bioreactor metagenome]|uniref:Uncharacterized protein n=1 Tax=bioreactor metagenome TaxID=1076179 RepID=A0A645E949_9ZZZZ